MERDPVIEAYKKDLDRTMIRENRKRTPEERVKALIAMHQFYDEAQRMRRARKR
jgi:hypothetical protein